MGMMGSWTKWTVGRFRLMLCSAQVSVGTVDRRIGSHVKVRNPFPCAHANGAVERRDIV